MPRGLLKLGFTVKINGVMDGYSRKVLSWEVSVSVDKSFGVNALERALRLYPESEIFNTDQASQFTGQAVTGTLNEAVKKSTWMVRGVPWIIL